MSEISKYSLVQQKLILAPKKWLITGVAGFIGSNILEKLLKLNQKVVGLDNFSTGFKHNLDEVQSLVSDEQWKNFTFIHGDICDISTCELAVQDVNYVLHQAALGSVPRSIENPVATNLANISGFLNMLDASKNANIDSFTYAASSSTYGDHPALPKIEENIGKPLSPYAVTKYVNELYADVYSKVYNFNTIGLRYFNVFGKRQNPNGAYAAVIPKWIDAIYNGNNVVINGDGETSRDFCYIDNVIQMNILAAVADGQHKNNVYNVAVGDKTSLNQLFNYINTYISHIKNTPPLTPIYNDFRPGDVRHSQADISKAKNSLLYLPEFDIKSGLKITIDWYLKKQ